MKAINYFNTKLHELFEQYAQTDLPEHKSELLRELRSAIRNIEGKSSETIKSSIHISESITEFNEQIKLKNNSNSGCFKNLSGFSEFDRKFGGFPYGSLIIVGGRPNMGCDYLLLNIALFNAIQRKNTVSYFELDNSLNQLLVNIFAIQSAVKISDINLGHLSKEDIENWEICVNELKKSPIYIDDSNGTVEDFREKIKQTVKENSSRLVFVDCLQMIQPDYKHRTRDQEVSSISKMLKQVAKELDITIIASSQLSRAVENRSGSKSPTLSDLRESGNIEQDADMVIFLYRPELYGLENDWEGNNLKGIAQLLIAKNKFGAMGEVSLNFNPDTGKFTDVEVPNDFSFFNNSKRLDEFNITNDNQSPY